MKEEIKEIFEELRERLNFHFRNAENKEDLIERIEQAIDEMEKNYKNN